MSETCSHAFAVVLIGHFFPPTHTCTADGPTPVEAGLQGSRGSADVMVSVKPSPQACCIPFPLSECSRLSVAICQYKNYTPGQERFGMFVGIVEQWVE